MDVDTTQICGTMDSMSEYAKMSPERRKRKAATDKAWRQAHARDENVRKRKQERNRKRVSKTRKCSVCEGPISDRNKSGICSKNFECRAAQQARRNGNPPGTRKQRGDSRWLLPIVFDLDTGEEIIDDVAIQVAFEGTRKVGLTVTERAMVIKRMITSGARLREIADHIGTSPGKLKPILSEMGYVTIPRRAPGSHGREATEILTVEAHERMQARKQRVHADVSSGW